MSLRNIASDLSRQLRVPTTRLCVSRRKVYQLRWQSTFRQFPPNPSCPASSMTCSSKLPQPLQIPQRRYSSQPPSGPSSSNLTEDEYNEIADRDMDTIHESIEILCEDFGSGDWEVEYSSGVMTIRLPPYGTYVINKQPPNQQIWMSSPLSGPSRFGWEATESAWTHHRKSEITLGSLLEQEIRQLAEKSSIDVGEWEGTVLK